MLVSINTYKYLGDLIRGVYVGVNSFQHHLVRRWVCGDAVMRWCHGTKGTPLRLRLVDADRRKITLKDIPDFVISCGHWNSIWKKQIPGFFCLAAGESPCPPTTGIFIVDPHSHCVNVRKKSTGFFSRRSTRCRRRKENFDFISMSQRCSCAAWPAWFEEGSIPTNPRWIGLIWVDQYYEILINIPTCLPFWQHVQDVSYRIPVASGSTWVDGDSGFWAIRTVFMW